jgi:hypothetical protein
MPEWTDEIRTRLAGLRLSPEREAEIIEELSQHLEQRYEDLRDAGETVAEARRKAIDELLETDALANHMRSLRQAHVSTPIAPGAPSDSLLDGFWQDLRYAVRSMCKRPAFFLSAILILAIGIGMNTVVFSIIKAVLLNPLPYPKPDELVMIWSQRPSDDRMHITEKAQRRTNDVWIGSESLLPQSMREDHHRSSCGAVICCMSQLRAARSASEKPMRVTPESKPPPPGRPKRREAYCCNWNVVSAVEMPPAPGSTVMRSLTALARARASVFASANPSGSMHDRRLNPLFTCGGSFRQRTNSCRFHGRMRKLMACVNEFCTAAFSTTPLQIRFSEASR